MLTKNRPASNPYSASLAIAIHGALNDLAAKLGENRRPDEPLTVEDLRETLLALADSLPAPE